jgi:hypothetical protein
MARKLFGRKALALAAAALLSLGIVGSASAGELTRGLEDGGCLYGIQVGTMTVGGHTYPICRTL